jgi:hypothetical protein
VDRHENVLAFGSVGSGFHHRSHREADLPVERRTTEVFDFLVKSLQPRVVFVHGRSAAMYLQDLAGTLIGRGAFAAVHHQGITFDVLAGHHLSYQWSYAAVEQLGRDLHARCIFRREAAAAEGRRGEPAGGHGRVASEGGQV